MPPEFEPLTPKDRDVLRLFTYNGDGRTLLGHTRPDGSGGRFATVWEVAFHFLPLYPLGRYYLFEGHMKATSGPVAGQTHIQTNYRIMGRTRLKPLEVLGTYLWGWLVCPAVAGLTLWVVIELFGVLDGLDAPKFLFIALFLVWLALLFVVPVGVAMGMAFLRARYQRLS